MNAIEKLMGNGRDSFVAFPEAELPERERIVLSDSDTGSWWFDYSDVIEIRSIRMIDLGTFRPAR